MVSCNSFTLSGTFILIKSQLWSVRRRLPCIPRERPGGFRPLWWSNVMVFAMLLNDGSAEGGIRNTEAGVYSIDFTLSYAIGRNFDKFDGAVKSTPVALSKVIKRVLTNQMALLIVFFPIVVNVDWLLSLPHLHPDLSDRHHVLDILLDTCRCRARQGHPVRHLPAHPRHPARPVPEVPAPVSYIKAIDIFMSTCTLFVFSSLMEYAIVNIVVGQAEERERLANKLLNDIQLIHMEGKSECQTEPKIARSPSLHRRSQSLERRAQKIDRSFLESFSLSSSSCSM
ncbi:glycine receptor subunit alpha-2 [Caerostris extrusa]|uniref:Glycine receptor subunit alpha-2 n=1 Tax=Caerostris extrusa TaxID=172846 RepID=A0AAV4VU16_CAEEX|nr:glycine receptor subunit alpha-2 [Caerostris extrusa]